MNSTVLETKPKCTLINRFDGSFLLIGRGGKEKLESLMAISEVELEVEKRGWMIGFIHPPLRKPEEG